MKQELMEFSTVGDFVQYVKETPVHPTNIKRERRSHLTGNERLRFTGTHNFNQACELALNGWPKGLENLTSKLDLCLANGKSRYRVNDVAGDYPDIGRFLSGVPVCMSRRVINDGLKRPIIELIFNATYSQYVSADSIMCYGAAIASVVDELETLGFRVGLKVVNISTTNVTNRKSGVLVTIKQPQEALELDKAVFALAHPSFQRRLSSAWKETENTNEELGHGYGRATDMETKDDAIYFPQHDCSYNTTGKAREYVKGIIRASRPDLFNDVSEAA